MGEVVFGSISNKQKATNWRYAEVVHVPESECYACHVLNPVGSMMSKKPCIVRVRYAILGIALLASVREVLTEPGAILRMVTGIISSPN